MNEDDDTQTGEYESHDSLTINEPTDEYPGSFFRIPVAPPSLNDTWSLT